MVEPDHVATLIVEDDPMFRSRFEEILSRADGYRIVASAASVADGIAAARASRIDLLVVDLGLPDGDGTAVIREISERQPECAVMVVTVFGDEEHVVNAIEAGASSYLLKDCNEQEFMAAIRDLLAGGSPMNPMVARLVLDRMRRMPPQPTPASSLDKPIELSERETEILTLVAKGFSFADICSLLSITNNTVKTHINRIYRKLAVHSRGQAVYEATKLGLLKL